MTFYKRIDEINEETRTETKDIVTSYEAQLATLDDMVQKTIKNRRPNRRNRMINIAKQTFPTKKQISRDACK